MQTGRHMLLLRRIAKFSGKYEHRHLTGGIGHNLPQEAPQAFAQAVADVDSMS
jgi:pimeloyl-ACP methyl ester carboxylesterase